jgi:hypothetical protein
MLQSFTNQFALSTCIKLAIQAGKLIALLYECNKGIAAATSDTSANGRTLLLGSCHTAVWSARVLAGERPHPRKCVAGAIWWAYTHNGHSITSITIDVCVFYLGYVPISSHSSDRTIIYGAILAP